MAPVRRILAALAGIAVAFLLVMVLTALTPDPELHEGRGTAAFDRFQFEEAELKFVEGTRVQLQNGGAVHATFIVTDPGGTNSTHAVGPKQAANITVTDEGHYRITTEEWFWAEQVWEVRSANPFTRYLEDLF